MLRATHAGPLDLLALHCLSPADYPFLLQSVAGHPTSGRYDILFAFPSAHLALRGGKLSASAGAPLAGGDFFAALSAWAARERVTERIADLPYAGGWFLLLSYELAGQIEPRLKLPPSPFRLPDALAVRCAGAVVHDHEHGAMHLLAESGAQLKRLERDCARAAATPAPTVSGAVVTAMEEEPPSRYLTAVRRIKEYLSAGDVFQVNPSRAWSGTLASGVAPADIYQRLRFSNPAPFAGLAAWEGSAVLSSSPERLVNIDGANVQTRPIAGTRPRDADPARDRLLREQLLANAKERAEHIMLIDLERNDLGRVCVPGSVEVSELMTLESYAHVHHLVSNVRGRLRPEAGPGEVLKAVFPGGTVTGCPKVRAMEIIAELEGEGRGPYTGAMGYLSRDGRMDTNILIRTLVCEAGRVHLRAGGGIVSDSEPDAELAETRAKARGLLAALGAPS